MTWNAFIKWLSDWFSYFVKAVKGDQTRDEDLRGLMLQVLGKLDKINSVPPEKLEALAKRIKFRTAQLKAAEDAAKKVIKP